MKIIAAGMVGRHSTHHDETLASTVTITTDAGYFELAPGDNLLDALLATGHAVEYQCRGGYCGACRTPVVNGSVDYDDFPLAHINGDEVLPCCCRVTQPLTLAVSRSDADCS